MDRLARIKKNFRIVKIDIDKWGSPVAQQYEIRSLPSLWLYDGDTLMSEDKNEVIAFLQKGP